jgi:hypothetical protein
VNPILIAAAKFEIDPLANSLQQLGHAPEAKLTGIGALAAAKKVKALGEACRGRHVFFVGTCGTFGPFQKVHLIRAADVVWLPTAERLGFSYTVKDSAPPITLPEPPAFARSLPAKRVICSPAISLVAKLDPTTTPDSAVENLELYSCIGEIAAQAARVAVILAVTNAVGPDSHSQWRQNFAAAAGLTAEFISSRVPKAQ